MPAQRESCGYDTCLWFGVILAERVPTLGCRRGEQLPPEQAMDRATLQFLWEDPVWVMPLMERGQVLFPGTDEQPCALESRRGSPWTAADRISPPHSVDGQQRGAGSQGSLFPRPPWHHGLEQAEITLISQIGTGSGQEGACR